jgi:hypothetical protein
MATRQTQLSNTGFPKREKLVRIQDIPVLLTQLFPELPEPVKLHTVHRWAKRGVAGVILRTTCIGGTVYTTPQECLRFQRAVTDAKLAR